MRITSTVFSAMAGVAFAAAAAPLAAQGVPLQPPKPPVRTQQAAAGPSRTPNYNRRDRDNRNYDNRNRVSVSNGYGAPANSGARRGGHRLVPYPAQVSVAHQVYANFGQGLIFIPTRCSSQLLGAYGPGSQPYADLETTQPVPQIQSATARAVQEHPGNPNPNAPDGRVMACWSQAPNGTVTVYRYY